MNKIFITGGISKVHPLRHTNNGKAVLGFDVANNQGYGENEHTEYYQCAVWEKQAESLNDKLTVGCKVAVSGEHRLDKREHEGKTYTNNKLDRIELDILKWADKQDVEQAQEPNNAVNNDFDTDVPF